MKLLNDKITLKILNKINNPFNKRPSSINIKTVEENLYNLSSCCLSLSSSLSIEENVRKQRRRNIKAIRSRGSTFHFITSSTYNTNIKIMNCIDEISIFSNSIYNIFYWISDEEDEVYPLIDMDELKNKIPLNHKRFNTATPLSSQNVIFY